MLNFLPPFFHSKKTQLFTTKLTTQKFTRRHMPKARRSTRNSDAMDAEGHEEVRRVFVFASSSCTFCLCVCLSFSFDDDVRVFLNPPISPIGDSIFPIVCFLFLLLRLLCVVCADRQRRSLRLCLSFFLSFARSIDRNSWKR